MASPHVRSNGAAGPRPQLPAFCRSRRPVVTVTASSITNLRLLVLLGLLFQLSTLLLVIAGPVPPEGEEGTSSNPGEELVRQRPRPLACCGPVISGPFSWPAGAAALGWEPRQSVHSHPDPPPHPCTAPP